MLSLTIFRSAPPQSRLSILAVMIAILCLPPPSWAQQSADESQIKAAFLFNFGKFVEWPETAASAKAPLTICVAGNDEVSRALEQLTAGKAINSKAVKVMLVRSLDISASCQILFIGRAAGKDKKTLLERTQHAPVLTVGEEEDFAGQGGILNLVQEKSRIYFEINQEAAARSGLRISSKLLALAQIVHGKELKASE